MVLTVYILISWLIIITFFLIPKGLTLIENIIAFFIFTIFTLNNFTIVDLNLKLITHSKIPEMYICILMQRNIITPLSLVILVNLIYYSEKMQSKIVFFIIILSELSLMELLSTSVGAKTYTGWNGFLTIALYTGEILVCSILTKGIKKIPSGEVK